MSKFKLVCPFSMKACRECGIFRGRHLGLCYVPKYQGHVINKEELTAKGEKIEKPKQKTGNTRFEFPDLPENPKWSSNLEDCFERRNG